MTNVDLLSLIISIASLVLAAMSFTISAIKNK